MSVQTCFVLPIAGVATVKLLQQVVACMGVMLRLKFFFDNVSGLL